MKKSLKNDLDSLFQNHSPNTHLPAIVLALELEENGIPHVKVIKARAFPVESLGMISIMREMLNELEDEILNKIDDLGRGKMKFDSSAELVGKNPVQNKVNEKELFERHLMDFIKNMF
jgi:hypothetical protein